MNYKNAITMTTLSVIAAFAIVSTIGIQFADVHAETFPVQDEKFTFAGKVIPFAKITFGDKTEIVGIQKYIQTAGLTLAQSSTSTASGVISAVNQRPSFSLEKIAGGSPYLYKIADQGLLNRWNNANNWDTKFVDIEMFLATDKGDVLRSFKYYSCQMMTYTVTTLADNEEAYSGKGPVFAVVDQFAFDCMSMQPGNPSLDKLEIVEHAKTISSSDMRSTDSWDKQFKTNP